MLEILQTSLQPNAIIGFFLYIISAALIVSVFTYIYTRITPHNEFALIREGNSSASIALGGTLVGFALPINSIITYSISILDFALWSVIACVVQLIAFSVARFLIKNLSDRITRNELSAGILTAFIAITAGLLNAACMVPAP